MPATHPSKSTEENTASVVPASGAGIEAELSPAEGLRLLEASARAAAEIREPVPAVPRGRELGLDYLRVFAFALLILYHCAMPFVSVDWVVDNAEENAVLEALALFCSRWRLPLLFFISGAAVCFSLERRSWRQFAGDRLLRLLLPLLFGMLVVVPPQIYFERLQNGTFHGSYLDFYPEVLRLVPYPMGAFGWLHLWFLAYILLFSLAGLPLLLRLKSSRGRRGVAMVATILERRRVAIYALTIPSIAATVLLSHRWPIAYNLISDWANLTSSLIFFGWGFLFALEPRLLALITRRRREFLTVSAMAGVLVLGTTRAALGGGWAGSDGDLWTGMTSSCLALTAVFALVGYARVLFQRRTKWLPWATDAVFPFYLVHQTITAAAAFYVVRWPLGVWPKFALITVATFLGCWALFAGARRLSFVRPLFGLKRERREAKRQPAAAEVPARGLRLGSPS